MAKKKKALEENIQNIKKAMDEKKIVIGTKEVMNGLRDNKIAEVYMASNCPEDVEKEIISLTVINGIKVLKLTQANDELGVVCKKPFSISLLGIKNG